MFNQSMLFSLLQSNARLSTSPLKKRNPFQMSNKSNEAPQLPLIPRKLNKKLSNKSTFPKLQELWTSIRQMLSFELELV